MTDKVQVEIKGDVATIMLNKPERLNALDNEMWHGIGEACRAVDAAPDVRVAVLMGAGGCFCAGLDVKAGSTLSTALEDMSPGQALDRIRQHLAGHQASFSAVEALPGAGHRRDPARLHGRGARAVALLRRAAGRRGHAVLDPGGAARPRARHGRHPAAAPHRRHREGQGADLLRPALRRRGGAPHRARAGGVPGRRAAGARGRAGRRDRGQRAARGAGGEAGDQRHLLGRHAARGSTGRPRSARARSSPRTARPA